MATEESTVAKLVISRFLRGEGEPNRRGLALPGLRRLRAGACKPLGCEFEALMISRDCAFAASACAKGQEDLRVVKPFGAQRMQKPRPNHCEYIEVLRRMTPAQRLAKAFELSEVSKRLFQQGLRKQFPDLSEEDFHRLYLERLAKSHNRNY